MQIKPFKLLVKKTNLKGCKTEACAPCELSSLFGGFFACRTKWLIQGVVTCVDFWWFLYVVRSCYYTVTLTWQISFQWYELLYVLLITLLHHFTVFDAPNSVVSTGSSIECCMHIHKWSPLSLSSFNFHRHLWCLQTCQPPTPKLAAENNPWGLTILISKNSFFQSEACHSREGTVRKSQPAAFH